MENIADRLLNPIVVLTMIGAGVAYGWFLWSLYIRPASRLWLTALVPGIVFLGVIWTIRAAQGVASLTYVALIADWFIFAVSGVVTVLVWRAWRGRRP